MLCPPAVARSRLDAALSAQTVQERKVTTLELFFDLVFVFGITQVTAYLAHDHSPRGFLEGFLLFFLLWWAWTGYTWLGTAVDVSSGRVRLAMFTAMAGLLVVALGMPEWFHDAPAGLAGFIDAPVLVALAYVAVRVAHIALFAIAGRGSPGLGAAVARFGSAVAVAAVLVITGAIVGGTAQLVLVAAAVVLDYGGALLGRGEGWVLSPGHFAERHGLIVIIALGESIVAIGVGAAGIPLSWPVVLVAVLGMAIAARLWVLYFDSFAEQIEEVVRSLSGRAQNTAARDVYSYGHSGLVAGIVLIALGLKKAIATVGEYSLDEELALYAAAAFLAGIGLFLAIRQMILLRAGCDWDVPGVIAAVLAIALIALVGSTPVVLTLVVGLALLFVGGRRLTAGRWASTDAT